MTETTMPFSPLLIVGVLVILVVLFLIWKVIKYVIVIGVLAGIIFALYSFGAFNNLGLP